MAEQSLLRCGPFLGLQASSEPAYLEPGHALTASNVDVSYRYGAFNSALGRTLLGSITIPAGYTIQGIATLKTFGGAGPTQKTARVYVFSAINASGTTYQGWYDPVANTTKQLPYASGFTQAVQFGSALWTNGGDKIYYLYNGSLDSDVWQINVPYQFSYNITGTYAVTAGNAPVDTYTYAITLRKAESWTVYGNPLTIQPDLDSFQESSPVFSTSVTVASGQQPGITIPSTLNLQTLISGLTPGSDSYYGALYRSRVGSPAFQFVDYLTNIAQMNDHNGNLSLIDTYPDFSIQGNAYLVTHHDAPPMLGQTYPGATVNNSSPSWQAQQQIQTSFTYKNPAFITKHKGRMWCFTLYPSAPLSPPSGRVTTTSLQPQLWWSDPGVPWSFDDVNGLVLVGPEDTPGNYSIDANIAKNAPWAPGMLEDTPMGIESTGSILVLFKSASTSILLGDSPQEFVTGVRPLCDIGCISSKSITRSEGGVFWLAPQGVYFFSGGQPSYVGEDVRGLIEGLTWSDQQNAVGSYRDRTFYLSFSNITVAYYIPSKKWYSLPYGASLAISSPYNQNQLLFLNGTSLNSVAVNPATDLGSPIVSQWVSGVTDSGKSSQLKGYNKIEVVAAIQPGTVTVQLDLDISSGITNTYKVTWDLSLGNGAHVVSLPQKMKGYEAQLTITTTTAAGATQPISLRSVEVTGDLQHGKLPIAHDPSVISQFLNGKNVTSG